MRPVVIGTAGHIDHGKTALVHRLTGIDTDRLKEEKERGISIDLGFAHLTLPSGRRVAIVDVPGHERFVKNMLAGATGIDLVLLVVAADEGVMPQTREHLAIVDLLDVRRGVVALTKTDLANDEMLRLAADEVRSTLAPTGLKDAPIIPVSSVTGAGIPELLGAIDRLAAEAGSREPSGPARLPIDRVFSVEGIGTVVTGTLWSGSIRPGDALTLLPADRAVRVRQVEVHDEPVAAAVAGNRTAVAIHGAARDEISRGDWFVTPGSFRATEVLDVRLRTLESAGKPLASRARVRLHLGASEILARAFLFERDPVSPGDLALAQLRLEAPVVSVPGDHLVLRSYSPAMTIGGATVIDSFPQRRARLNPVSLARLRALESCALPERLTLLVGESGFRGLRDEDLALRLGTDAASVARASAGGQGIVRLRDGRLLALEAWKGALERTVEAVRRYGVEHPLRHGVPKGELKSLLQRELDPTVFDEVLEIHVREGRLSFQGDRVSLPEVTPSLTPEQEGALEAIVRRLQGSGFQVPDLEGVLRDLPASSGPAELVRYLVEARRVVKVTSDLYYPTALWDEIEAHVRAHFAGNPTLTMAAFKDLLQVSRKYAVPLLEHLDRTGLTRRKGDVRVPGPRASA